MEEKSPRWLSFDPTIHAGHLITACSIIICTLGMWYGCGRFSIANYAARQEEAAAVA